MKRQTKRRWLRPSFEVLGERQLLSTIVVNVPTDGTEAGTLRSAIELVNNDSTGTITEIDIETPTPMQVTNGLLTLSRTVTIQGNGDSVSTNSSIGLFQVIGANTSVEIDSLAMSGTGTGIGIYNNGASSLTLKGAGLSNFTIGLEDDLGVTVNAFFTSFANNSGSAVDATLGTDSKGDPNTAYLFNCTVSGNGGPALNFQMNASNDEAGIEYTTFFDTTGAAVSANLGPAMKLTLLNVTFDSGVNVTADYVGAAYIVLPAPSPPGGGGTGTGGTGTGTGTGTGAAPAAQMLLNLRQYQVVTFRERDGVVTELVLRRLKRSAPGLVTRTLVIQHPLVVQEQLPGHKVVNETFSNVDLTVQFGKKQSDVGKFVNTFVRLSK